MFPPARYLLLIVISLACACVDSEPGPPADDATGDSLTGADGDAQPRQPGRDDYRHVAEAPVVSGCWLVSVVADTPALHIGEIGTATVSVWDLDETPAPPGVRVVVGSDSHLVSLQGEYGPILAFLGSEGHVDVGYAGFVDGEATLCAAVADECAGKAVCTEVTFLRRR